MNSDRPDAAAQDGPARPDLDRPAKRSRPNEKIDVDRGYLTHFCQNISGPKVAFLYRSVTVAFEELDNLSTAIYNGIVNIVFAAQEVPAGLITLNQWNSVIRAVFKSRVDHVSSNISLVRPADRLPLNTQFRLPRVIADAINSYGIITVRENSLAVYPLSTVAAQGVAGPGFDVAEVRLFQSFISIAEQRAFIVTSCLTDSLLGTAAWMLPAFATSTGRQIGADGDVLVPATVDTLSIFVRSQFSEFTPADVILAAMMVNGRVSRIVLASNDFPWFADEVVNAPVLRCHLAGSY